MKKVIIPPVGGKGSFVSSPSEGAHALTRFLLGDPAPFWRILWSVAAAKAPDTEWAPAATCWREFASNRRSFGRLIKRLGVPTAGRGKAILVNLAALKEALQRGAVSNDAAAPAAPRKVAQDPDEAKLRAALGLSPSKGGR